MRNLARELANNESMIEQDVKQMFEFEKNISQVNLNFKLIDDMVQFLYLVLLELG